MMIRIQKLLMYEYSDFEETVVVESSFAQVTESGVGIKQVQIGLTPTKLIIGSDNFNNLPSNPFANVFCSKNDPEVETMELLSVLPLEFLHIKVFRKGSRQLMKVTVGPNKSMLFEFGGYLLRNVYWNIWRDRISTLRATRSMLPSPLFSSSSNFIPEQEAITVEINQVDSLSSRSLFKISSKSDILCSKNPSPRPSAIESIDWVPNNIIRNNAHENVLREVAEFFLDTQSEIILGRQKYDENSCDGSCRDFLRKTMSLDNMSRCRDSYSGL